jgi:hypothetical protein
MVTVAGTGTALGAVYVPLASMVPCALSPPVTPFTCQVTAVLEVFETCTVNFNVLEICTEALAGSTSMDTFCCAEDWIWPQPQIATTARSSPAIDTILQLRPQVTKSMYTFPLDKTINTSS